MISGCYTARHDLVEKRTPAKRVTAALLSSVTAHDVFDKVITVLENENIPRYALAEAAFRGASRCIDKKCRGS